MQKFKEQLPSVCVLALLIIGAAVWTLSSVNARQDAALTPLRDQNDALKAQLDENRRQLETTSQILKEAIARRDSDLFRTDVEISKLNTERIDTLARTIAKQVVTAMPAPKTAEEAAQMQDAQVDQVSSRMAEKIRPLLAGLNQGQEQLTTAQQTINRDDQQIQQLNDNLQATQAAAQDALKLSHEISALYLDSFNNQGLLVRVLSLPSDMVKDTAHLNLITSHDRDKAQQQLSSKMQEIEKRLDEIQAQSSKG